MSRRTKAANGRLAVFNLVSVSLISLGFMQGAAAGPIGTQALLESEIGAARTARLDVLLEREDIARQLAAFGVDPAEIRQRVAAMSDAEIAALERRIDARLVGGDALGVIGAVFLVLLILELVGVTDVFSKI